MAPGTAEFSCWRFAGDLNLFKIITIAGGCAAAISRKKLNKRATKFDRCLKKLKEKLCFCRYIKIGVNFARLAFRAFMLKDI